MAKGREHAATNLTRVVDIIRRHRQSGLLSVERMHRGKLEEGEIYFQDGRPMYAQAGNMRGQEALIWLLSWQQVYFAFLIDESRHTAHTPAPVDVPTNLVAVDTPAIPLNTFAPASTDPLPPMRSHSLVEYSPERVEAPVSSTPGLEWIIPRKSGHDHDVLALPLTRPQRSIYLLIDGQRTVADLSRCMRKSIQEIERLLSELQARGLISV